MNITDYLTLLYFKVKETDRYANMADGCMHITLDCDDIVLDDITLLTNRKIHEANAETCNVRQQTDKYTCHISGACALASNFIILADYNNSKLKCLNVKTMTLQHSCTLKGKPWSVCLVSNHEVAVSIPDRKVVQWFQLRDALVPVRAITLSHQINCLEFRDGELFLDGPGSLIYIYTPTGTPLRQLTSRVRQDSKNASPCSAMALSCKGDILFVAYLDTGLLAIDHRDGQVLWQFVSSNEQVLPGASCVCADGSGTLYIVGGDPQKVLQFNENGASVGDFPTADTHPFVLCFDACNTKLFLSFGESDIIKMISV